MQTAEKASIKFFMVLKEKMSASFLSEAFLPIPVDILGVTLHFELDHLFLTKTETNKTKPNQPN